MKCEVLWRYPNDIRPHGSCGAEAVCLVVGTALDADYEGHYANIFAVCEDHATVGTSGGWVKISPQVARQIGQMEEALRKGP